MGWKRHPRPAGSREESFQGLLLAPPRLLGASFTSVRAVRSLAGRWSRWQWCLDFLRISRRARRGGSGLPPPCLDLLLAPRLANLGGLVSLAFILARRRGLSSGSRARRSVLPPLVLLCRTSETSSPLLRFFFALSTPRRSIRRAVSSPPPPSSLPGLGSGANVPSSPTGARCGRRRRDTRKRTQ